MHSISVSNFEEKSVTILKNYCRLAADKRTMFVFKYHNKWAYQEISKLTVGKCGKNCLLG